MKALKEITKIVSSACSAQSSVMAAYIFGSLAKGKSQNADVDVAVLLDSNCSQNFPILSFITELELSLECHADVVILNRANELLKYEVRRYGRLVFERSSEFRKYFEIQSRKRYEDFLYLHNRYVNTVLYREKNG